MKSCDKKKLALRAAGALDPEEQRTCEAHLAECSECRKVHSEMTTISNGFVSHATALPPVYGVGRLHHALELHLRNEQERPERSRKDLWFRTWFFRLAASIAAVAAMVMIWSNGWKFARNSGSSQMVQTSPPATKKVNIPPAPTLSSYSSATRHSLEEFDRALDAQIRTVASPRARNADSPISLNALL